MDTTQSNQTQETQISQQLNKIHIESDEIKPNYRIFHITRENSILHKYTNTEPTPQFNQINNYIDTKIDIELLKQNYNLDDLDEIIKNDTSYRDSLYEYLQEWMIDFKNSALNFKENTYYLLYYITFQLRSSL
jgi:hypothetical protein